jgi:hypothetical protein
VLGLDWPLHNRMAVELMTEEVWFNEDFKVIGEHIHGWSQIYIVEGLKLEHLDDHTDCSHGLGIPFKVWTAIYVPLHCTADRIVRAKSVSSPFYIDDLPWTRDDTNWIGPDNG